MLTHPFTILIDALFSACIALYFVEVIALHKWAPSPARIMATMMHKTQGLSLKEKIGAFMRRKPLGCAVCLSAWVGLLVGLLKYANAYAFYPMFIGGVIGLFLSKYLHKP